MANTGKQDEYVLDVDYVQSANTLFHFMSKIEYLNSILIKRAIVPRYCRENVEYLNIYGEGTKVQEVAVLQKCFCDIPFHKLADRLELSGIGEVFDSLNEAERALLMNNNTHPGFYGEFAIAFSKRWGEENNLQPIHYLSEQSLYAKDFTDLFNSVLQTDELPTEYANDILNRLAFVKPLRGIMKRGFKKEDGENIEIEQYKNFHDEQEWRYVPSVVALSEVKMEKIIVAPHIVALYSGINESLENERFKGLWLKFKYDDIRYIIVPDAQSRIDMIDTIMELPDEQFDGEDALVKRQKHILLSKIQVLDEIGKDW